MLCCSAAAGDWNTPTTIRVRNSLVRVSPSMKYLGVFLDSRLTFKPHFYHIDEKLSIITRALWRLMPNLRGPQERKRRLYAGILESVVLYAAPIWAGSLNARRLFHRWQRAIAIRVCSAYRSVSFDSAILLARIIPYELLAAEKARIFWRVQDAKEAGLAWLEEMDDIRVQERTITLRQWMYWLPGLWSQIEGCSSSTFSCLGEQEMGWPHFQNHLIVNRPWMFW